MNAREKYIDFTRDPREVAKELLQYIPKSELLRSWGKYIPLLWENLPKHLRMDDEVISYLSCEAHYNTDDMLDHIDGPAPARRNCDKCVREAQRKKTGQTSHTKEKYIDFTRDPREFAKDVLEYIPKSEVLRYWGKYIPSLWSNLPEHLHPDQ